MIKNIMNRNSDDFSIHVLHAYGKTLCEVFGVKHGTTCTCLLEAHTDPVSTVAHLPTQDNRLVD